MPPRGTAFPLGINTHLWHSCTVSCSSSSTSVSEMSPALLAAVWVAIPQRWDCSDRPLRWGSLWVLSCEGTFTCLNMCWESVVLSTTPLVLCMSPPLSSVNLTCLVSSLVVRCPLMCLCMGWVVGGDCLEGGCCLRTEGGDCIEGGEGCGYLERGCCLKTEGGDCLERGCCLRTEECVCWAKWEVLLCDFLRLCSCCSSRTLVFEGVFPLDTAQWVRLLGVYMDCWGVVRVRWFINGFVWSSDVHSSISWILY